MVNNRNRFLPLTETTFYILIVLKEPSHGYEIMQKVEVLSGGDVRIAAGTMYGALENLSKHKLIQGVPNRESRRKVYQLSALGKDVINAEIVRLEQLLNVAKKIGG